MPLFTTLSEASERHALQLRGSRAAAERYRRCRFRACLAALRLALFLFFAAIFLFLARTRSMWSRKTFGLWPVRNFCTRVWSAPFAANPVNPALSAPNARVPRQPPTKPRPNPRSTCQRSTAWTRETGGHCREAVCLLLEEPQAPRSRNRAPGFRSRSHPQALP